MRLWPAYRLAARAATPGLSWLLRRRARAGKEDGTRLGERWGRATAPRPAGPVVWCHAASVGESLSLLPLVERLLGLRPDLWILVTTGTLTSARLMADRLDKVRAFHQFAPVDHPAAVDRFLRHWHPDLGIWIESELWPTLVLEAKRRGLRMALLNARMSHKSARGWRRIPAHSADLLGAFDLVLAQDERQARQIRGLGAGDAISVGDLKSAASEPQYSSHEVASWRHQLSGRTVWLAASTHEGEEIAIADAHTALRAQIPDLLTLIAPRHPARSDSVAAMLDARQLHTARRSRSESPQRETDIWLIDTLGELGLFYRLVPLAFVGGSLGPPGSIGGHNPIEAAAASCAILHGPDMANCAAATARLDAADAAIEIVDAKRLSEIVGILLRDRTRLKAMGQAARQVVEADRSVLDAVMAHLLPLLPPLHAST